MRSILLILCILSVTCKTQAQGYFDKKYQPGCYYSYTNQKTCGLVNWAIPARESVNASYITFKPNEKTTAKKIAATTIKSFTVGADTFAVSRSYLLEKFPVVKVLAYKQVLKLYRSVIGPGASGLSKEVTYYFGISADNLEALNPANFIGTMCAVLADDPELVMRIKRKEYRYGDIEDLLANYRPNAPLQKLQ